MDIRTYERTTAEKFKGKRARTLRDFETKYTKLAAGTIVTITGKRRGLTITTDQCGKCGVSIIVSEIHPHELALLEETGNA